MLAVTILAAPLAAGKLTVWKKQNKEAVIIIAAKRER